MRARLRRMLLSLVSADPRRKEESAAAAVDATGAICVAEGIIRRVDARFRWLELFVDGVGPDFYVPSECPVVLNGERVKLRFLQPQDRAKLSYSAEHGLFIAHSITVDCRAFDTAEDRREDTGRLTCATAPRSSDPAACSRAKSALTGS